METAILYVQIVVEEELYLYNRIFWLKDRLWLKRSKILVTLVCFCQNFTVKLNFIERYWGAAKRYARNNCNYTWSGLQETVPCALDSVDLITIRRFARKTWRYMDLYRHGITGKLAENAAKKYILHRRIWDELQTN